MSEKIVKVLKAEKTQIAAQINKLEAKAKAIDVALAALTEPVKGGTASPARIKALAKARAAKAAKAKGTNKRKKMSAKGRKAIAAAKKKWWADKKKAEEAAKAAKPAKK